MTVKWSFLGLTEYEKALALQHDLRDQLRQGSRVDYLLMLTHPPTITRGYSERGDAGLIESRERLAAEGIKVFDVDRGGKTTYHGPDQLVGYFIFDLNRRKIKPRSLIENIAEAIITVLDTYGIEANYNQEDPGVEVDKGKIAFLGINVQKGITTHGFSLNVGNDQKPFHYIVPCGKVGRKITSMEEMTGTSHSIFDVCWRFVTALGELIDDEVEEVFVDEQLML